MGKTDVVRNIDQNATLLAVLQKFACLPDLVTKVNNIESKVDEVASLREELLKMNEKLLTVSNTCDSNSHNLPNLEQRVSKLESSSKSPLSDNEQELMKR